jgi:anti-anti-sigma factor
MNAGEFEREIEPALADGGVDLEMDCTELNYMASSGLRVIQKTMRTVMQQKGQFKMTNVSPEIYKVLNMTGFTKFMKVEQRKD